MSAASDVRLVARREFRERGRDRSFLVSALVTVLILVGIVTIPALFSKPTTYSIGVVGADARRVADAAVQTASASKIRTKVVEYADPDAARAAATDGTVDVALLDATHAATKDQVKPELAAVLGDASRRVSMTTALQQAGVSGSDVQRLVDAPPLAVTPLKPRSAADATRQGIATLTVLVLYGQLIGYAMWVANGVVEEKSSRVIEVLTATVRPRRLMTGKVVGVGGLALVQLIVVSIAAIVAAVSVGRVTIPANAYGGMAVSFVWFLAGFAFFAFLFAGAASLVSRQEDLQNIVTPLTLVLVGSLFAGLNASGNPNTPLSVALSFVPPVSSVVMPTRYAAGGVPLWQAGISFLIMLAAVAGIVRLAGRMYTVSVLRAKTSWREALRTPAA